MILSLALVTDVAGAPAGDLGSMLATGPAQTVFFGVVMIGFMYFAIIRPQQRRAKEHAAKIGSIKRGDTVILASGMIGKVVRVEDTELGIEIAQNVTVKVVKSMVSEVRTRADPATPIVAKS